MTKLLASDERRRAAPRRETAVRLGAANAVSVGVVQLSQAA
jgi:hypothetical protein